MAARPSPECSPAPILVQPVLPRQHIVGIQWEEGWVYGTEGLGERQLVCGKRLHPCLSACRDSMAPQQHWRLLWRWMRVPRCTETSWKHSGTSKGAVVERGRGCSARCHWCPCSRCRGSALPEGPSSPPDRHRVGPGEETGQRSPHKAQLCPAGSGNRQINGL